MSDPAMIHNELVELGVPVIQVTIPDETDKNTWLVELESEIYRQQVDDFIAAWDLLTVPQKQAVVTVNQQASIQYEAWQSAYASYGDWLAILQVVETSLRATRRDALDEIEAATTEAEIEAVVAGLTWPPVPDQATIEADVGDSLTAKQEAKDFLDDYPNARLLIDLPYANLLTAIDDAYRTDNTNQKILLAQTYAISIRYLKQLIR